MFNECHKLYNKGRLIYHSIDINKPKNISNNSETSSILLRNNVILSVKTNNMTKKTIKEEVDKKCDF